MRSIGKENRSKVKKTTLGIPIFKKWAEEEKLAKESTNGRSNTQRKNKKRLMIFLNPREKAVSKGSGGERECQNDQKMALFSSAPTFLEKHCFSNFKH